MRKLTRDPKAVRAYAPYATQEQTLVVGQDGAYSNPYFPNLIRVDIDPSQKPDIIADAHALPFENESFGTVLAPTLLAHVFHPQNVVDELYRVLKPKGTLIFGATFMMPHNTAPHDYWRFTRNGCERLCADFSSITITPLTGEFTTVGIMVERILMQSDLRGGRFTKGILFVVSRFLTYFDWLVVKSYGNLEKSIEVPEIMTHGYFVVCKK